MTNLITDKLPASALLNEDNQPINDFVPYGNIPVSLFRGTTVCFQLIPEQDTIHGIRLRFGTYCRVNHCYVTIQIGDYRDVIPSESLQDNEYVNIALRKPQSCTVGQPLEIQIYSEDADDDNVVALWSSRLPPDFINPFHVLPLSVTAQPRVSIIIPVFNKALYTYNCLLTVQAHDPDISKEVIVVNNASSDSTATLLDSLQGNFAAIHNTENHGFVQACRQGAEAARGEFLVFLNNDTQVTPGWLYNMLTVMDAHAEVGVIGSKLIYPNGRLQEAGGIIFNDASGWNYGRMQDPTDPKYNQSRAVDYCSGASLMVRTSLWEQLGGFDTRYAPAYYEDTDLCFAARAAGFKVWYCHESEVIHHEGITAGTDITSGYKAYQATNKTKFFEKWQAILQAEHLPPPPETEPEKAAWRLK